MTMVVRVKLPLYVSTTRNFWRRYKQFCLSRVSRNLLLNISIGTVMHMSMQSIEFDVPFPWVIYSLHFAQCIMSESTFTMNVFRFWRSRKYNSLWTFLCEPYSMQHYWQICLICRQFPLYNINWIGFYSINLLKNLTYISKSQYGGDLALWLACLCTVNSSFILF
jgi:hypothetical protein